MLLSIENYIRSVYVNTDLLESKVLAKIEEDIEEVEFVNSKN